MSGLRLQTAPAGPAVAAQGQALPLAERQYFESMFDADLSQVRIDTSPRAALSTQILGANAATCGQQIAFGAGQYNGSQRGRQLLAHELAHVLQQQMPAPALQMEGGDSHAQAENQAGQVSRDSSGGHKPEVGHAPAGEVYCEEKDKKPEDSAPLLPLAPRLRLNPLLFPPTGAPATSFGLGLDPKATDFIPPMSRFTPFNKFSNADVLSTFSAYGTSPAGAGFNMGEDLQRVYWMLRSYLPESLAASFTSGALGATYAASLARDQPNIFDKSNLDFKAAYPNASATPIIPFFSSSTMTSLYEAISGKKNTNQFYF